MAGVLVATARTVRRRGLAPLRLRAVRAAACACAFASCATPALAAPSAQISGLSDLAFGTITNFAADSVKSENVCVFSNTKLNGYNVTAHGTGTNGAFTLASSSNTLAYEVQWNGTSGQTSGTQLSPYVALGSQTSSATQATCNKGPTSSASLIVILRSSAIISATAGVYSGTLTLVIAPE